MLPEIYILTERINIITKDDQYQYRVTFSIFGEIVAITMPFLKLPINAQRLTKGKDTEKYLLALSIQQKLLRYKLPLAILGFWKSDEFEKILSAISTRELELAEALPNDFFSLISDPWLRDFYLKIKEDIEKKGTGDFWRGLAGLMSGDPMVLEESFRYLRAYTWQLPAAIIGDLWPTISDRRVLRHFYEHAHLYPSEPTKNWLLKELPKESATFFRGLILRGLAAYSDNTVYLALLNHFEVQKEMGEGESELLIFALSEYHTPAVHQIAWNAFTGKNYFAAKAAHLVLTKQGVTEKVLAEQLRTFILDNQYSDRVNSLLSRFQHLQDNTVLLSAEQFLARSAYAVKAHPNIRLQTNLASLLDRTWQTNTLSILIEFLYHPEPTVRRLGLDQIRSLVVQYPKRMVFFNPDTVKRIFQLTGDANTSVTVEAVETLRTLVPKLGQPSWIIFLLNVKNRITLLIHILPAILALHRKGFAELAVVPFCIKHLGSKHTPVKNYSILILQYYKIPEVIEALQKISVDQDPVIREALGRGWREDDDLIKILR